MTQMTPEQNARFIFNLTKGKACPDAVAKTFIANAKNSREYARKAAASKTGKYRGYTESRCLADAQWQDEYAVLVPAILRRMLEQAS